MFEGIFGIDIKKKTQILKSRNPNLLDLIGVDYMGGHILYPENKATELYFYVDKIIIVIDKNNNIIINYKDIININNNHRYSINMLTLLLLTEITYNDENNFTQNILLNFGQSTPQAQGLIYKKMLELRQKGAE